MCMTISLLLSRVTISTQIPGHDPPITTDSNPAYGEVNFKLSVEHDQ